MVNYEVTVHTGNLAGAGTVNNVFIKLVGEEGESKQKWLMSVKGVSAVLIGMLVLIELNKHRLPLMPEDSWFPAKIVVKSPEGDTYTFPIYRWITGSKVQPGMCIQRDSHTALKQITQPHCPVRFNSPSPRQQNFSTLQPLGEQTPIHSHLSPACQCTCISHVFHSVVIKLISFPRLTELKLKGLSCSKKNWNNMDDIKQAFCRHTSISDYVQEHWQEDAFFGYQYLNGVNPALIRRCKTLPSNFPIKDGMVFLSGQGSLSDEMEKGNIFLCDYKLLDGVKENTINGKKQSLTAPLLLLHKTPDDQLKPIAIQLKQVPGEDNPIFVPSDSEYDWLTAKVFVNGADFSHHQLNTHLLRTHLLAEVFAVSLLRNIPMVHPLHKLLVPHTRYTLQINFLARQFLISKTGIFTLYSASGGEGMLTVLKRALSSLTYTSLCIPDDIAERGLESVPNFHYRDDGLKLWDIIYKFVDGVLSHYYKNDAAVEQDTEVQNWISDIFEHGFLSQACTGIPQRFTAVCDLVKFVTMVMFTGSGQHSAVNSGQYDYGGWMPNAPISLQRPPPTKKGTTDQSTLLQTLPDVSTTVQGVSTLWLLSKRSSDFVTLGQYPEEHFSEEVPSKLIKNFQGELEVLTAIIKNRNQALEVPYTYMDPEQVENSVAI
uniref:Hydroperoxide isomerase ALOXE3-like n=1 Tax=Gouania willdenowi TaxID=441366 RepID=A0A8C5GI01_GOUWI